MLKYIMIYHFFFDLETIQGSFCHGIKWNTIQSYNVKEALYINIRLISTSTRPITFYSPDSRLKTKKLMFTNIFNLQQLHKVWQFPGVFSFLIKLNCDFVILKMKSYNIFEISNKSH